MDHGNLTPIKSTGCKEGPDDRLMIGLVLTLLDIQLGFWTTNKSRGLAVSVRWF